MLCLQTQAGELGQMNADQFSTHLDHFSQRNVLPPSKTEAVRSSETSDRRSICDL